MLFGISQYFGRKMKLQFQIGECNFEHEFVLAINSSSLFNLFFGDDFFPSIFRNQILKEFFLNTIVEKLLLSAFQQQCRSILFRYNRKCKMN